MERKYYLRGLGLGIAVTAIIMGVALPDSQAMTNDEIIARAKELGLVENTVLSNTDNEDGQQENEADDRADDQDVADQSQDGLAAAGSVIDTGPRAGDAVANEEEDSPKTGGKITPEANDAGQGSADPENGESEGNPESEDAIRREEQKNTVFHEEDNSGEENADEVITPTTVKVITINSGDGSYTVAKKLADAGVVTSAQNFDDFLCRNGYDKRLRTGSFSIPTDASDEQIARIVTGME